MKYAISVRFTSKALSSLDVFLEVRIVVIDGFEGNSAFVIGGGALLDNHHGHDDTHDQEHDNHHDDPHPERHSLTRG